MGVVSRLVGPLLAAMALVSMLDASAASAQQDGDELFRDGRARHVSRSTADSDCLGDPRTPLCAIDTYEACMVRFDLGLCRSLGMDVDRDYDLIFQFDDGNIRPFEVFTIAYYITSIETIERDLVFVRAFTRQCGAYTEHPACDTVHGTWYLLWRPDGRLWRLAAWQDVLGLFL